MHVIDPFLWITFLIQSAIIKVADFSTDRKDRTQVYSLPIASSIGLSSPYQPQGLLIFLIYSFGLYGSSAKCANKIVHAPNPLVVTFPNPKTIKVKGSQTGANFSIYSSGRSNVGVVVLAHWRHKNTDSTRLSSNPSWATPGNQTKESKRTTEIIFDTLNASHLCMLHFWAA